MVKEGYGYGLPLVLIAGTLLGLGVYSAAGAVLVLALLILNFFRDPERAIPGDPDGIVSPADGRVVQIVDEAWEGVAGRRVSIFMSPLDVHVNRSPVAGTIESVTYHRGRFRIASAPQASIENEHNVFIVRGEHGTVAVKQIAGLLARRIVFWKKPGDTLKRGERIGLIKFGSRVDVVVSTDVELQVQVGDHVRAGSSLLGITRRNPTAPA